MDQALAWIGQIAQWVGAFIPRWVILDTTEAAIKYRHGQPILCPGGRIHWYWPAVSAFYQYPTARQAEQLETQTMVSTDDKTFIVGGILVFSIEDLMALFPTTFSPSQTIRDIAMTAIHDVCCNMSWEELKAEQRKGTLDTKLKNAAQKQLSDYGVKVIKLMLTSLAPCRVLKLSQSVANEEK